VVASRQTAWTRSRRCAGMAPRRKLEWIICLSAFYATKRVDAVLSPYDGLRSASCRRSGCRLWQRQHADADRQRAGCGSSFIKSMLRGEQYSTIFKDTRDLAKVTRHGGRGAERQDRDGERHHHLQNGVKVVPSYLSSRW